MKLLRRAFAHKIAVHALAGTKRALEHMRDLGWCRSVAHTADGMLVAWAPEADSFLRACGWEEGSEVGRHRAVVRFALLLDLLAMEAPPRFALDLVNTVAGERWSGILLADVGRGRYRPCWWDAGWDWHEDLRRGLVPMPLLFPWVVRDGIVSMAQRLAEFGWLDFEACDVGGRRAYAAGAWNSEALPFVTLVALHLSRREPPAGLDPVLDVVGRLSLLLQLRAIRAPAELLLRVLTGVEGTDVWVASLAHRVTRGIMPVWWDRRVSWHAAVRGALADLVREKEAAPGAKG